MFCQEICLPKFILFDSMYGEMSNKKQPPLGIKLISIYFFLGAVLDLFVGFMLIFSRETVINSFPSYLQDFYYILIPFQIGLGIFEYFMARALWQTKKWARMAVFIVSGFQIIMSTALMIQGNRTSSITHIMLYIIFISYLLFNKKAKNFS